MKIINKTDLILLLICLLYVLIPTFYILFENFDYPVFGTDDANILMVYAKNFANGYGIVYNIDGEKVEGFSCFLYFIIASIFYSFLNAPYKLLLIYNLLALSFTFFFALKTIKKILYETGNNLKITLLFLVPILLAYILNPSLFTWAVISLMDTSTYTLILSLMLYFIVLKISNNDTNKNFNFLISVITSLILITRPEGIIWGLFAIVVMVALSLINDSNISSSIIKTKGVILTYIITILALTLFRLAYFGYPLPNTYYTKVSASIINNITDGWNYFITFASEYNYLVLLPTLLLFIQVIYNINRNNYKDLLFQYSYVLILFNIVAMLIPIIEGGDHFKGFRFYQFIYIFLFLPIPLNIIHFKLNHAFEVVLLSTITIMAAIFLFYFNNWKDFYYSNNNLQNIKNINFCIRNEFEIAKHSRINGNNLNELFRSIEKLPAIGYGSAGGIKYTYNGVVYDMMGLNNTKLAHADKIKIGPKGHQSFNKNVFFELSPDILMPFCNYNYSYTELEWANSYYTDINSWDNKIFKNIFNETKFKENYTLALIKKEQSDLGCFGYFKNSFLNEMKEKSYNVVIY